MNAWTKDKIWPLLLNTMATRPYKCKMCISQRPEKSNEKEEIGRMM